MASVFRKSESQYWFASFKDRQGVWRNKSTQTTNKTDARKIAETFERVATRKLSAQRAAEAIRELYHDLSGEGAPKATVREFSAHWIRNKSKEKLSPQHSTHTKILLSNFLVRSGNEPMRTSPISKRTMSLPSATFWRTDSPPRRRTSISRSSK